MGISNGGLLGETKSVLVAIWTQFTLVELVQTHEDCVITFISSFEGKS